jgi:hypothetical protein
MAKDDIQALLSKFEKKWKGIQPRQPRGGVLEAGRYELEVGIPSSGKVVGQDSDGGIRARITLTVRGAKDIELIGRTTTKSYTLVQPDGEPGELGMEIVKADLLLLGAGETALSDIGEAFAGVAGTVVDSTIRIKQDKAGNDQEQIFFNKLKSGAASRPSGGKKKF